MQAKITDKKEMETLCNKITAATRNLLDCQDEFNIMIWSEKANG